MFVRARISETGPCYGEWCRGRGGEYGQGVPLGLSLSLQSLVRGGVLMASWMIHTLKKKPHKKALRKRRAACLMAVLNPH